MTSAVSSWSDSWSYSQLNPYVGNWAESQWIDWSSKPNIGSDKWGSNDDDAVVMPEKWRSKSADLYEKKLLKSSDDKFPLIWDSVTWKNADDNSRVPNWWFDAWKAKEYKWKWNNKDDKNMYCSGKYYPRSTSWVHTHPCEWKNVWGQWKKVCHNESWDKHDDGWISGDIHAWYKKNNKWYRPSSWKSKTSKDESWSKYLPFWYCHTKADQWWRDGAYQWWSKDVNEYKWNKDENNKWSDSWNKWGEWKDSQWKPQGEQGKWKDNDNSWKDNDNKWNDDNKWKDAKKP